MAGNAPRDDLVEQFAASVHEPLHVHILPGRSRSDEHREEVTDRDQAASDCAHVQEHWSGGPNDPDPSQKPVFQGAALVIPDVIAIFDGESTVYGAWSYVPPPAQNTDGLRLRRHDFLTQ